MVVVMVVGKARVLEGVGIGRQDWVMRANAGQGCL